MIGDGLGVDRLGLFTHAKREVVILAALKTFAVSANLVEKITREDLQVIDIHQGPKQLRTPIGFVHTADQKTVGIDLNRVGVNPRRMVITQTAQRLRKALAHHHIIVINRRQ